MEFVHKQDPRYVRAKELYDQEQFEAAAEAYAELLESLCVAPRTASSARSGLTVAGAADVVCRVEKYGEKGDECVPIYFAYADALISAAEVRGAPGAREGRAG